MIPDGYRVLVTYNSEREKFVATVPELDNLKVEAASRPEAIGQIEQEIEARFRQAAEKGTPLPSPLDQAEFSGKFEVEVSPDLHRELVFHARGQGIELNQLVTEIIAVGIAARTRKPSQGPRPHTGRDGQNHGNRGRQQKGGRQNRSYFDIMDDKASFLEYVRNLDNRGGGGGGGRRGGRGR